MESSTKERQQPRGAVGVLYAYLCRCSRGTTASYALAGLQRKHGRSRRSNQMSEKGGGRKAALRVYACVSVRLCDCGQGAATEQTEPNDRQQRGRRRGKKRKKRRCLLVLPFCVVCVGLRVAKQNVGFLCCCEKGLVDSLSWRLFDGGSVRVVHRRFQGRQEVPLGEKWGRRGGGTRRRDCEEWQEQHERCHVVM